MSMSDTESARYRPTEDRRVRFVQHLIDVGAVSSQEIADAIASVPRELFVPGAVVEDAYRDESVALKKDERGMWVSCLTQPSLLARMLGALGIVSGQRVLEIGTGSGYCTAVLSLLVGSGGAVRSIEVDPDLASRAVWALRQGGYDARVLVGDGRAGWAQEGPFDAILVSAGTATFPRAWLDQLKEGGHLVAPFRLSDSVEGQTVVAFRRVGHQMSSVAFIQGGCVPLRGSANQPSTDRCSVLSAVDTSDGQPNVFSDISGASLGLLSTKERRRLLASSLTPPVRIPIDVPLPLEMFTIFCLLARPEAPFVEHWTEGQDRPRFGVLDQMGGGMATVDSVDAHAVAIWSFGDRGASELLLRLSADYLALHESVDHELSLRVQFSQPNVPAPWRVQLRDDAYLCFDWQPGPREPSGCGESP
jgi:protein-L-isoaspartate(D-aspartate) O-methyltransferase